MAKLYARKILNKEINPNTNKEWTLKDVPERWRKEVKKLIEG